MNNTNKVENTNTISLKTLDTALEDIFTVDEIVEQHLELADGERYCAAIRKHHGINQEALEIECLDNYISNMIKVASRS